MPVPYTLADVWERGGDEVLATYLGQALSQSGTPISPAVGDYVVAASSAGFTARSLTGGADFSHATDAASVVSSAVAALGASGGKILLAGNLAWGSVPALPKNITGKLHIQGISPVKVTLSAGGPRLFDFNRSADHDTFQNIEITDILVDCNNVDGATHTIIGTRTGTGTPDQRVNIQNLAIRRVRATNIPASATNRSGISLSTRQAGGGEGTQNFIKDILIEDVILEGGSGGFFVSGAPSGAITNLNILIDNIRIIRCKHVQQTATVVPVNSASYQIGQNGPVGYVLIRDCYGEYSADVGLEIDNANLADVENCTMGNCKTGFFYTNFAIPTQFASQTINFRRCRAVVTDANVAAGSAFFRNGVSNSLALGDVAFDGCVFHHSANNMTTGAAPNMFALDVAATNTRRFSVARCRMNVESINWNNASPSGAIKGISLTGQTIGLLEILGFDIKVAGSISGAGAVSFRGIGNESGAASVQFRIDGFDVDYNITGVAGAGATYGILLVPSAASTVGGSIRRMRFINLGSDTASKGIRLGSTTNLTISPGPITVEECDFSGITTGGNEFQVDATQTALGAVLTRANKWKTKPVPVGLTGLVTATGKRLGAQSAAVIWQALAVFTQGSGAAITAVDFSTNDGTTYTNFLTQASAALPAGFDQTVGPLPSDALIKVTFTTTQPTITLVPCNP